MESVEEILSLVESVEVIAGGNYGCVFLLTLIDGRKFADKVELIGENISSEEIRRNARVHANISTFPRGTESEGGLCLSIVRLLGIKQETGLPQLFLEASSRYVDMTRSKRPQTGMRRTMETGFCHVLHKGIEQRSLNRDVKGKIWPPITHSIMEYANGGSLRDYVVDLRQNGSSLSGPDILNTMFYLIWTLKCLWNAKGFVHGDIRMPNIVLDYQDKPTYILCDDFTTRGSWGLIIEKGKPIPKLTDFGHANLLESYEGGPPIESNQGTYMFGSDPRNLFTSFVLLASKSTDRLANDTYNDMWAFSLAMLEIIIYPVLGRNLFSLHESANPYSPIYHEAFKSLAFHLFYGINGGYFEPLDEEDLAKRNRRLTSLNTMASVISGPLIGVCLLNMALGNGLFPDASKMQGLRESAFYNFLFFNRNPIIHMSLIGMTKPVAGTTPKITTCYDEVVSIIERKLGRNGVDFFKKSFAWDRGDDGFLSWNEMLDHPIFLEFIPRYKKIEKLLSSDSSEMERNYVSKCETSEKIRHFRLPTLGDEARETLMGAFRNSGFPDMPRGFTPKQASDIPTNFPVLSTHDKERLYAIKTGVIGIPSHDFVREEILPYEAEYVDDQLPEGVVPYA